MTDTKRPAKETKTGFVGFRAKESLEQRIAIVAEKEKRSRSQIVEMCVEEHLSVLEKQYGIQPPITSVQGTSKKVSQDNAQKVFGGKKPTNN